MTNTVEKAIDRVTANDRELGHLLESRKRICNLLHTRESRRLLGENTRLIAVNTGIPIEIVKKIY